jgi:hypothetical protein
MRNVEGENGATRPSKLEPPAVSDEGGEARKGRSSAIVPTDPRSGLIETFRLFHVENRHHFICKAEFEYRYVENIGRRQVFGRGISV